MNLSEEYLVVMRQQKVLIERIEGLTVSHSGLLSTLSSIRYKIEAMENREKERDKDRQITAWIIVGLLVLNLFF
jgi:hypothetical protein